MRTVEAAGLSIGDAHPPRIMGVLNLSPESPYDPSVHEDPEAAARHVEDGLIAEGADIVDVGLSSANKRFAVRSADDELDRLADALEVLDRVSAGAVFSIETRYAEVAAAALDGGFDMVNDICGFADPEMPEVCAARDAAVVKMASPPDLSRPGALCDVDEIYAALKRGGLTEQTIVDPAFGGWTEEKTLDDDRAIFERLREFRGLDRPILISINRKNFLRTIADRSTERALPVSLAATSMAVERGAHVVRTHDVAETRDAALVGRAFSRERVRAGRVEELDVTTVREAERHLDRLGLGPAAAPGSVARAFEVSGLEPAGVDTLERAAAEAGVTVAAGADAAFVAGTAAGLADLAGSLDSTPLVDVGARIDPGR